MEHSVRGHIETSLSDTELPVALEQAMADYRKLLDEFEARRIDTPTFNRRALDIGLIIRDRDAWILDLNSRRWWRYDGVALLTPTIGDTDGTDQRG